MTDVTTDLEMSRANLRACAYNAAVNWGTGRATKKMRDLLLAINLNERLEGAAKMDELVRLGAIKTYDMCPSECRVFPGGMRHAERHVIEDDYVCITFTKDQAHELYGQLREALGLEDR